MSLLASLFQSIYSNITNKISTKSTSNTTNMTGKTSLSNNTNGNSNQTLQKTSKKWNKWRTKGYTVMPHVSPQSKKIAENYSLRPSDVVVLSFPKTGTTWTQTVCEQLRTNAEGYEGFDDITERQPWLEFAHDCGQNLDEDIHGMIPQNQKTDVETNRKGPVLTPRIFKSHQLLSAINPGAKYLCIVRDPAATLLSWFDFQKAKGRPGYAEYEYADEYIANRPELFSGNHIFGTNLWEVRTLFVQCEPLAIHAAQHSPEFLLFHSTKDVRRTMVREERSLGEDPGVRRINSRRFTRILESSPDNRGFSRMHEKQKQ